MLEILNADVARARAGTATPGRGALRMVASSFGLQALLVYRLGRWIGSTARRPAGRGLAILLWPCYRFLAWIVRKAYGIALELSADIGPGLRIHHFGGIHLRGCTLGANCVIHQEVIVEPSSEGSSGPRLGDRVWIGPHARIVGSFTIEGGATIGAGTIVDRDVPASCLVMGSPCRLVYIGYDNSTLP